MASLYYYFAVMPSREEPQKVINLKPSNLVYEGSNDNVKVDFVKGIVERTIDEPDYVKEQKYYRNKCGIDPTFDIVKVLENLGKENLSSVQLKVIQKMDDHCLGWFNHLDSLSNDELLSLDTEVKENKKMILEFSSLNIAEKNDLSLSVLKGESVKANKGMALGHLLGFDNDLVKKIADSIGTKNIVGITTKSMEIVKLYDCKIGTIDCSENGMLMITHCLINEEHCGMDYYDKLNSDMTVNEVNHLYNIVDSLISIIEAGYPENI